MKPCSRIGIALITIIAVAVLAVAPGETLAAKKVKPYKSHASQTFVNAGGVAAYGLVVTLSSNGEVVLDEHHAAGPFRNVNGNGQLKLTLTNPAKPIPASGDSDAQVTLEFQSYSDGIRVKSYYWTDLAGKRIGKKTKV